MGLPHLCLAKNNDREKRPQPRRAAPFGALCENRPRIRPHLVVAPKARRGGVWGCVIAPQTPRQFRFLRAEGQVREQSPTRAELCVAPRRGGVGSCVRVPPTSEIWTPTPRARLFVPCSFPKLPLLVPSGAGRGLWWLLVRVPLLRALCGQLREVGGGAVGEAAQNRARRFGAKRVCPESAAFDSFDPVDPKRPYRPAALLKPTASPPSRGASADSAKQRDTDEQPP